MTKFYKGTSGKLTAYAYPHAFEGYKIRFCKQHYNTIFARRLWIELSGEKYNIQFEGEEDVSPTCIESVYINDEE